METDFAQASDRFAAASVAATSALNEWQRTISSEALALAGNRLLVRQLVRVLRQTAAGYLEVARAIEARADAADSATKKAS